MGIKTLVRKFICKYYQGRFLHLGENTKINPTSSIHKMKLISIGDCSFIGKWCHISVVEPATLTIGNYVGISPYVKILAGDRNLSVVGKYFMTVLDGQNKSIVIEDDTMIGMEAMILKGVTIGEGSIVGARAVVTKDVLPYSIAVGSPAKMVKLRFSLGDIEKHMNAINSQYKFDELVVRYERAGLI